MSKQVAALSLPQAIRRPFSEHFLFGQRRETDSNRQRETESEMEQTAEKEANRSAHQCSLCIALFYALLLLSVDQKKSTSFSLHHFEMVKKNQWQIGF